MMYFFEEIGGFENCFRDVFFPIFFLMLFLVRK